MAVQGWTHSLSLWCLNPAVVFKEIAETCLSVILTSGTLSPMNSFASELGVPFEICMEAPHVINMDSQVWAAAVTAGPGNVSLNASYKTADGYAFQDALGAALEEICKIVPDGTLIFFPSYKLMDKLCNRWKVTGQWIRLNSQKTVFIEPRGSQDDFELVLSGYYSAIHGEKRGTIHKVKDAYKKVSKPCRSKEVLHLGSKGGAAFLAVCRGKVSEGIDFADENARAVIIVGIPFPNKKDIQVELKKRYNNENKSSKNLLSGDQWYCHQAFRALNQAVGRCIRHRLDFGAIILLDERFKRASNLAYMSKWLRNSIRQFDNFNQSIEELHGFFSKLKDQKQEMIADSNKLTTKLLSMVDSDSLTCKENASVLRAKATSKEVTKKATQKIQYFFSCKQSDRDDDMAQEVTNACDSMERSDFQHDSKMITNEHMETDPAIQGTQEDATDAGGHANSTQSIQQFKYFQPSLQETNGIQSSLQLEDLSMRTKSSSDHLLSLTEVETAECSDQSLCQIQTLRLAGYSIGSGQLSQGSDLVKCSDALVYGERLIPSNMTPGRVSEDDFVLNHYSPSSVGMSRNKNRRKMRNPMNFQGNRDIKTIHFEQQTEAKDLYQQYQVECCVSPENKVLSCQKIRNACLEGNTSSSTDNQCESTLISSSTSQSTVVECLDCSIVKSDVVETQSMELSAFQAPKLQSDSSICSLSDSKNTTVANKDITKKIYSISCIFCGHSFGLPEKQFHIRCTATSLSKSYLSILANRQQGFPPKLYNIGEKSSPTPVIISDAAFLNQLFIKIPDPSQCSLTSSSADTQQKSIWVEQDGCVFKALFCPQCGVSKISVGVHVVATDFSNMSLLNKVIFLKDYVKLVDAEPSVPIKVHKDQNKIEASNIGNDLSIEDYSYNSNSKRTRSVTTTKTKLKLPKKE